MADSPAHVVASVTAASKPGVETSEYALTRWTAIVAAGIAALGAIAAVVPESVLGGNKYVALAVMIVGVLGKVLVTLGYTKSRADVKGAVLDFVSVADPPAAPLVKTLEDLVPDAVIPAPRAPVAAPAVAAPAASPS